MAKRELLDEMENGRRAMKEAERCREKTRQTEKMDQVIAGMNKTEDLRERLEELEAEQAQEKKNLRSVNKRLHNLNKSIDKIDKSLKKADQKVEKLDALKQKILRLEHNYEELDNKLTNMPLHPEEEIEEVKRPEPLLQAYL